MPTLEFELTIAAAGTTSNVLGRNKLRFARQIVISSPASSEVATVQVSAVDGDIAAAGDWVALQTEGPTPADIVTAPLKGTSLPRPAYLGMRLVSGAAAAERVHRIMIKE